MNGILLVGLNHKTAPVELRERCRVDDLPAALAELRGSATETVLVSTCNRFEIYAHDCGDPAAIVAWIAARAGVEPEEIRTHCYIRTDRNASKHLFFVTSSLDSLVVGETQIRGQVKQSYRAAQEAGSVGPQLHRLFQAALRVSKEIAETTGVGRGNISVAGAAADLAERVFGDLAAARVLVVGAGETAELVMSHMQGRGVSRFHVANRTPERAAELARRYGGDGSGLEDLAVRVAEADVLVCAAGGDDPLVDARLVKAALRRRKGRPIVAIDIAVPRGIDRDVDAVDNVYRYDMEALSAITQDALRHRRKDFLQCCTLIDGATLRLAADGRAQEAGNAIAELQRHYFEVAEAELRDLQNKLPELDEASRELVHRAIHRIVRKLMHTPVVLLREGEPQQREVIRQVFRVPRRRGD